MHPVCKIWHATHSPSQEHLQRCTHIEHSTQRKFWKHLTPENLGLSQFLDFYDNLKLLKTKKVGLSANRTIKLRQGRERKHRLKFIFA